MSELIEKLTTLRANLTQEDQNFRACLVDDALGRIHLLERTVEACWREIVASGNAGSEDYGWPSCRELFFECFPAQRETKP